MNAALFPMLVAVTALQALPPELKPLLRALERARYAVFLAPPQIGRAHV